MDPCHDLGGLEKAYNIPSRRVFGAWRGSSQSGASIESPEKNKLWIASYRNHNWSQCSSISVLTEQSRCKDQTSKESRTRRGGTLRDHHPHLQAPFLHIHTDSTSTHFLRQSKSHWISLNNGLSIDWKASLSSSVSLDTMYFPANVSNSTGRNRVMPLSQQESERDRIYS